MKQKNNKGKLLQNQNSGEGKYSFLFVCLVFLLVFLTVFSYIFDSKLSLNGDNFAYLLLAKSIAQGFGYTNLYSLGQLPAGHFPPGYPFILSIFMFLKINNVIFFKILNGLFFFGSVCLLASWMKKITQNTAFIISVGILILLNTGLLSYATIIMSELPYLFFTCLTFWGLYKLDERKDFWRSPYFYIMVISAVGAYYIRSVALALLISIFIYFLIQKRWKISLGFLGSVFILYLPWIIRNKIYGIEGRYFSTMMLANAWRPEEGNIATFSGFFNKLMTNLDDTVIKGFKEVMFPFINIDTSMPSGIGAIIGAIILLAFIFYGAWNCGKYRYLIILYILGNIGTFLLWHGGNGSRYVHPLTPFLLFTFFWGILSLLKQLKILNNYQKVLPFIFLIVAFFHIEPLKEQHALAKMPYPPAFKNYFALAKSFNPKNEQEINKDIIVCCRKPEMFSYYSNCLTTNYKFSLDPKEVIEEMIETNINYVVLEQLGYSSTVRYLYPAIQAYPEAFEIVSHLPNPDTYLFVFNKQKAIEKLKESTLKEQ